jgi:hypothetical protein
MHLAVTASWSASVSSPATGQRGRLVSFTALSFAAFGVPVVADLPLADHFDGGSPGHGLLTALWGLGAIAGSWTAARGLRSSTEAMGVSLVSAAIAVSFGSIAAIPGFASIVLVDTIGGIGGGYAFRP